MDVCCGLTGGSDSESLVSRLQCDGGLGGTFLITLTAHETASAAGKTVDWQT